jgi:Bacterial regulatory proteins, crp family.
MGMFADRFEAMSMLLEEVAFNRMDNRLAKFLLQKHHQGKLTTTHEAIALEMGTAREVVSRLLNDFQKKAMSNFPVVSCSSNLSKRYPSCLKTESK